MSHDLVGLGIAPFNLTPNQPTIDSGPLLVQAVTYAQQNAISTITVDPGAYYFLTEQQPGITVVLSDIEGITIDFQGSDLYFASQNHGIQFNASSNVTLENFTVDRMQLDFTQLLVTRVDPVGYQIGFTVQPGWQPPTALNTLLSGQISPGTWAFAFRNGKQIHFRVSVNLPFANDHITLPANPVVAEFLSGLRPGDILVLAARFGGQAIRATCSSCTFRNIKIYSGYEGFNLQGPSSGTVLDHVYVMPRPGTDRLVSTMADGITMDQPGPDNTIQFCRAIRTLDDGFSPHIWVFAQVQSALSTNSLQVAGVQTTSLSQNLTLPNGSNVVFQRMSDGQILGNAVLVSQSNETVTGGIPNVVLTFDRALPANLTGSFVYSTDANWRATGLTIKRSALQFESLVSSMTLWGLMNASVTGNYIREAAGQGIAGLHTLAGGWETPPVINLSIAQNVIDGAPTIVDLVDTGAFGAIQTLALKPGNPPGLMAVGPNQNLTVANNFIAGASRSAVFIGNVTGASVTGNYLLDPNSNPVPGDVVAPLNVDVTQPISMEASVSVTTANNTIDQTSGRMWVTDTQYNELAAYAPGTSYRLNAYSLGTLTNPGITLTDGSGVVSPVTIQKTSPHALDVLIPASAALGGAYFTLTSGNQKYFGTLFLDSQDNIPVLNGCTYEVSLSSASLPATASSLPILVVTQAGCSYQPLNTASLASLGASTTGTAVVSAPFAANAGPSQTITIEIAGQQFTLTQAALIPAIQAVYDVWNYTSGIAPGAWVAIGGTGLAAGSPQIWNVTGTQLPTSLNGVTVSFNGMPAALEYVSSTQINAIVPSGVAPGPVQVIVQSNGLSGSAFIVNATATLPAIYALPNADGSTFFVTAALQGTALLVGNGALDPRVVRGAQPGDILDLYMIGLGATADPSQFITNQIFAGAYPVAAQVTATVGGESAPVLFAGLTSPGLYLVRVSIPSDLAAGQSAIRISVGGLPTRSNLSLTLGAAPTVNLVQNGTFQSPLSGTWQFSLDTSTGAAATVQETTSPSIPGSASAEISVTAAAAHTSANTPCLYCAVQFWQPGYPVQQGHVYLLRFSAMADSARTMNFGLTQNGGTYQSYGLSTTVGLGPSWQQYLTYFQATATDPAARLNFFFGQQAGNTWLDAVVLQDTTP